MKLRAILSRKNNDQIKSKILSPVLAEIVLECYVSTTEFAKLVEEYFEKEFVIEIKDE